MDGSAYVRLSGGRRLAYEEFGDADGYPVVFCHGTLDSRTSARMLDAAARRASVRLVAPDRPGVGASTYKQRRRIRDWPDDVAALTGVLDVERFGVLGWRGGAAYALACAHDLPDAVAGAAVVSPKPPPSVVRSSVGRLARLRYDLVSYLPLARLPAVRQVARRLSVDPVALLREHARAGPPSDERALRVVADTQQEGQRRAFRQGLLGPLRDVTLQHRGWGFRLEGVTRPVALWHGRADPVVPPARAERMAERLPDCSATFFDGDGHYSVLVDHDREVLARLAAAPA